MLLSTTMNWKIIPLKKGEKMSENEKVGTEPDFPEMCQNSSKP